MVIIEWNIRLKWVNLIKNVDSKGDQFRPLRVTRITMSISILQGYYLPFTMDRREVDINLNL